MKGKLDFDILIDDTLFDLISDNSIKLCNNENLLSLSNDFEDESWRFQKFQNFIWDNITETALSYRERQSLIDKPQSALIESSKNLRLIDLDKDQTNQGSELGEIILYGIMKHYYKALPVVPKIFYKQNNQDNAKGADSVHIVIESDNDFSLWLGEAKFYNNIENERLGSIIDSIENLLDTDKIKKENSIITSVKDLEDILDKDSDIYKSIVSLLSKGTSMDLIKPKLHVPIFLLYECPITKEFNEFSEEFKENICGYHLDRAKAFFKKLINKKDNISKYESIHFHLILFPVPNKQTIVDSFVENVVFYKNK